MPLGVDGMGSIAEVYAVGSFKLKSLACYSVTKWVGFVTGALLRGGYRTHIENQQLTRVILYSVWGKEGIVTP